MSTTIRTAVISTLALFALLIVPSARADGFDITGQTDTALCNMIKPNCAAVSLTMEAETQPGLITGQTGAPAIGKVFLITGFTGTLNGEPIHPTMFQTDPMTGILYDGWLYPNLGFIPLFTNIYFTDNGQTGQIGFDDFIGSVFLILGGNGENSPYITWNAVPIATPEPSSFVLLNVGIMALLGALGTAKRFL